MSCEHMRAHTITTMPARGIYCREHTPSLDLSCETRGCTAAVFMRKRADKSARGGRKAARAAANDPRRRSMTEMASLVPRK